MIPMCREPKRFVATLNKFRFHFAKLDKRRNFAIKAINSIDFNQSRRNVKVSCPSFSTSVCVAEPMEISSKKHSPIKALKFHLNLLGPRPAAWWTGKAPIYGVCPGVSQSGYIHSLPQLVWQQGSLTKGTLQAYFDNTWTMTEVLFSCLQGEEAFVRPPHHDLRHPLIFYYGHPAVLYVNKLRVAGLLKEPINPYFEAIFETGVDEMSWDDLSKNRMTWPTVEAVHEYRSVVYQAVSAIIEQLSDADLKNMGQDSPLWSLVMGFEHERIHLETSSVLINELPIDFVQRPEHFPKYHPSLPTRDQEVLQPQASVDYPVNEMVDVPAQTVRIGKNREFPSFGWDNEYGQREFCLPAFRASKYKISNGEFLEFVRDGGYARTELWTEIGWKWRTFRNAKWPTFWQRKGPQGHHEYDLRLLFDITPMPWSWPVSVNYHEAAAFAKWKSLQTGKNLRLLCETEHRAIRNNQTEAETQSVRGDHAACLTGEDAFHKGGINVNLSYSSQSPVHALPANSKGFCDVFGNAWEWMNDYFCALPGFQVHPYYEDFSTPCFDGLHHVIQGGSFISTGNEASTHARFHFRPHFHQHASFRLVEQLVADDETGFVTSDRDAPGPYVGNYPFRKSHSHQSKELQQEQQNLSQQRLQSLLSRNYFGLCSSSNNHGSNKMTASTESLFLQHSTTALAHILADLAGRFFPGGATKLRQSGRLLEVGSGCGGLTLQLAPHVHRAIGFDHHADFVAAAQEIAKQGRGRVTLLGEKGEPTHCEFRLPVSDCQVEFRCADPVCLPAELKDFDLVVLNDVLATVAAPNAILGRLGGVRGFVKPQGLLFVLDSFDWQETRTPRSLWLGDQSQNSSAEALKAKLLMEGFELKLEEPVELFWKKDLRHFNGLQQTLMVFYRK